MSAMIGDIVLGVHSKEVILMLERELRQEVGKIELDKHKIPVLKSKGSYQNGNRPLSAKD